MKKSLSILITILIPAILLLAFLLLPGDRVSAGLPDQPGASPTLLADPVTVITVTSGTDPDVSQSKTCISDTPCTLRRAIVQARNVSDAERPVLIAFNIPEDEAEGWDSALDIWKIEINPSLIETTIFRRLNGDIIIDGATQPGGRADGPKIFIVGPGTGQKDGLIVGDVAGDNNHVIRGLGFQNLKTQIYMNTDNNLIEDCWFGLSDDGTGIYLRGGNEDDGSGNTGISVSDGANDNLIQNNVFTGLAGVAANIVGDHNTFSSNYVGTQADGNVPDLEPNLVCSPVDWLGGSGLSIGSTDNVIEDNIIAGIRIAVELPTIQADSIRLGGDYHIVQNNLIGVDADGDEVGVCGRGVYLIAGTTFNQVLNNRIVSPEYSAISLNDSPTISTSDANTLRANIIVKYTPWGQLEDMPSPEDAIQMTKSLPEEFRNFKPAAVTVIDGVNLSGTSGANSPCGGCTVEVFLDDTDSVTETLQSLAVVTADSNGNWSATLSAELTESQGLRTTSTTNNYGVIPNMYAGTTTGLSILYTPAPEGYFSYLSIVAK
jgi:hypothetical protein